MPAPTYYARAGWLTGDWTEIGSKWNWSQIAGNFRWEELQAGPVPDVDVEEVQIARQVATMFDRLSTGECRVQMDNARGQYTGNKSAQNLFWWSDDLSSANLFWISTSAQGIAVSPDVLLARDGSITADLLVENTLNGQHTFRCTPSMAVISGQAHCFTADVYPGPSGNIATFVFKATDGSEQNGFESYWKSIGSLVSLGGAKTVGSGSFTGASVQVMSGGWYRLQMAGVFATAAAQLKFYFGNSAFNVSYVGVASAYIGLGAFQCVRASAPTSFWATAGAPIYPRDTFISPNDVFTLKAQDGSSLYNLFSGYVEQWGFNPALRDTRKIQFSAYDVAERLRPIISTSVMLNQTHRAILQTVMSQSAIDPLQYSIDAMNDLVAVSYLDQMSAGEALAQLQQNGAQLYYVDGAGKLALRSRHWDVASQAPVASVSAAFGMTIALSTDSILNRLELSTTPRKLIQDVSTVAWISDALYVPASTTRTFIIDYADAETNETGVPVIDIEPQVRGIDYAFNAAPTGAGEDLTSQVVVSTSASATAAYVTVSNPGGANGYLTVCQLKGKPARRQPSISRIMRDDASIALYQERYTSVQADLVGTDNRLRDLGEFLLAERANPKPSLSFALKNEWPTNISADLLSRVFVVNTLANIASLFAVFELEHTIQFALGVEHVTQYKTQMMPLKNWFTFDSPTLGRMNYNRLGS